jgi:putative hemolysin
MNLFARLKVNTKGDSMFDFYKIRKNKVHKFRQKVNIHLDKGQYVLKTITTVDELIEALKLRYQVFHREMIGKSKPKGIDVDEFDFICDHLIIVDKKTSQIVGTYRLNCSAFSNQIYSAQEFNIRKIMELKGTKLELGRACIHRDFRNGLVINLLWRGIAQYMQATDSKILFGCASIKTESPRQAALIYRYFEAHNHLSEEYSCAPNFNFTMPDLNLWMKATANLAENKYFHSPSQGDITKNNFLFSESELTEVESLIPSLCRAYFKAGAVICGEPAYDKEFKCIDFLTALPRENLNRALWRRYNTTQPQTYVHNSESYHPVMTT